MIVSQTHTKTFFTRRIILERKYDESLKNSLNEETNKYQASQELNYKAFSQSAAPSGKEITAALDSAAHRW
jgi:hypothetical protein